MDLIFDETRDEMAYFYKPAAPSYTRPVAVRGTLWGRVVAAELRFLWVLRRALDRCGAGLVLRQFISNNPYRDVSLLTWCLTALGWWEFGLKMVWLTVPSLFACAALRGVVQAPRPFEFDRRLRPLADRQPTSYGFPSIESHMAVVTFGYMAHRMGGGAGWALMAGCGTAFVGLTRLYAGSRFAHQVLLSMALGGACLALYVGVLEDKVPDWGGDAKRKNLRLALLAPWALAFLAYVSLAIEDNSSYFFRIPNSEFVRVMAHILDVGAAAAQREGGASNPGDREALLRRGTGHRFRGSRGTVGAARREGDGGGGDDDGGDGDVGDGGGGDDEFEDFDPMRPYATSGLSGGERRRRLAGRQDSFFHLQHAMRAKDMERARLKRGAAGVGLARGELGGDGFSDDGGDDDGDDDGDGDDGDVGERGRWE